MLTEDGAPRRVVLATPDQPPGQRGLAEVAAGVFDLGIAGTRFCVDVEDPVLADRLRRHSGRVLAAVLAEVGSHLVAASPDRIVVRPVAQARVRTPIPPPGGESPAGSHTHLLPARLTGGRPLPQQRSLPEGWWVGAVAHLDDASPRTLTAVRRATSPAG